AGTDAGNVGTMHASSFTAELQAMKKSGLTDAQVLKAATLNGAVCFGQNSGEISKGKIADLVVLGRNPLENISNLTSAELVIKSGRPLSTDTLILETPEMLVQRQVNAYNARDIDAFLDTYSDHVELYDFPDSLIGRGKEQMRGMYSEMFRKVDDLHCQIVNRIRLNNTIIDHERVRFNNKFVQAVAIYEVKDGKIVKVTFKD
ncbi:MAG TPA: nuclear transport factor 2 family protein, partial [Chryseosolibacter sp.]|nr:nuclear transport factor 2 family protein [Chryseosolibacter sp.]